MIEIVPAMPRHINRIAKGMAEIDRMECAVFNHSPKDALRHGLMCSSLAWTALIDGEPEAMFGASTQSLLDNSGRPWLLLTEKARHYDVALVRLGRRYTQVLHSQYDLLHNWVHADNHKAIRWLTHLGFFVGAVDVIKGHPMRPFHRV